MMRVRSLFHALPICAALPALAQVSVLTFHNDQARTGWNSRESKLTPANVNAAGFGKQFSQSVDGIVQAQPLYLPHLTIPGKGLHNVLFIATEHDSVYAFDADSNLGANANPLWQVSLLPPGATTIPGSDYGGCNQIVPEIGITGTPVIDPAAGVIYLVAASKENGKPSHRFHALDILTGAERPNSPVVIQPAIVNAQGRTIAFDPARQASRPALLLLNGVVYTGWGSHCDQTSAQQPYYGWLIGFDAVTLARTLTFNITPTGSEGALWNGGGGPASDGTYVYFATGNGSFNGVDNFGDSVVRLDPATGAVADSFTPYNQQMLANQDLDLGSGGLMLFPGNDPSVPHLAVVGGKQGPLYLLNRDHLGGFSPSAPDPIQQYAADAIHPSYGVAAYFDSALYYGGRDDHLKRFVLPPGSSQFSVPAASESSATFAYPGTTPFISSNNQNEGIVWALENAAGSQFVLHAYAAADLTQELYNTNQNSARDSLGKFVKFTTGSVADGKVFIPGDHVVSVLTLLQLDCAADATGSVTISGGTLRYIPGSGDYVQILTVTNTSSSPIAGPISLALLNLPSGVTVHHPAGVAACQGVAGAPFINLGNDLAPGASAQLVLRFVDRSRTPIVYNPVALSGTGTR